MTRRLKPVEHRSPNPRVYVANVGDPRLPELAARIAEIIERTNTLGAPLLTEGERLVKQTAYEKARADRLEASAEALRAENVFLQKEVQRARGQLMDFEKIRAEVERLTTWKDQLVEQNTHLLAEVERLTKQVTLRDERLAVQEQNALALIELSDRLNAENERLKQVDAQRGAVVDDLRKQAGAAYP